VQISGSTVLLTGATGGIGHAIARALGARGAKLILTGRRSEILEPLATELGARALSVDLSARPELQRLIGEAGDVDILIANAALPATGTLDSFSVEEIDRAIEVNLRAPIILSHALAPAMVDRGRGQIVFISSLSGALRADLRASGVGVSAVFPGFISDAGMFADAGVELPTGVGTKTPEDVAKAVVTAIERNRGEIDVAPFSMRASIVFASIAPELAAKVGRRVGAEEIARQMDAGQRTKR